MSHNHFQSTLLGRYIGKAEQFPPFRHRSMTCSYHYIQVMELTSININLQETMAALKDRILVISNTVLDCRSMTISSPIEIAQLATINTVLNRDTCGIYPIPRSHNVYCSSRHRKSICIRIQSEYEKHWNSTL